MTIDDAIAMEELERAKQREEKWGARWLLYKEEREKEEEHRKQLAQESQKRNIAIANEIAEKLESLEFNERMYVLRIVVAMINNTKNHDILIEVHRRS